MSLAHSETKTYERMWGEVPAYKTHSPGAESVELFLKLATPHVENSILDAGCGPGAASKVLISEGYEDVTLLDLVDARDEELRHAHFPFIQQPLWSYLPSSFHHVLCCDVMEHIPTEMVGLVLDRLISQSYVNCFFTISLVRDQFGLWAGKPLHQTVRPFEWWRDRINDVCDIYPRARLLDARDALTTGIFLVAGGAE